jgi:hypothetical protein
MEPIEQRDASDDKASLLAHAIAGRLDAGTIWAVVLVFIVATCGLLLFSQTETTIGLEECKRQCAAAGKAPVYIPSEMGSAELYAKVVSNCQCR